MDPVILDRSNVLETWKVFLESFKEEWVPRRLRLMARELFQRMEGMGEEVWTYEPRAGPTECHQAQYLFLASLEAFEKERQNWLNGCSAPEPTWMELGY